MERRGAEEGVGVMVEVEGAAVSWELEELAESTDGVEEDEDLEEWVDACRRDMLGSCGRDVFDEAPVAEWSSSALSPSISSSSEPISSRSASSLSSSLSSTPSVESAADAD